MGTASMVTWMPTASRLGSQLAAKDVKMVRRYEPNPTAAIEEKYEKFCKLYKMALEVAKM